MNDEKVVEIEKIEKIAEELKVKSESMDVENDLFDSGFKCGFEFGVSALLSKIKRMK